MKASRIFIVFLLLFLSVAHQGFAQDRRGVQDTVERGGWLVSYGAELRGREAEAGEVAPGVSLYSRDAARNWARSLVEEAVRQAEGRYGASALYSFGRSEQRDARRALIDTVSSLLRDRRAGESRMVRGTVEFKAGVMVYVDSSRGRERFVPYAGIRMQRDFDRRSHRSDRDRGYDRQPSQPERDYDDERRQPRHNYSR